MMARLCWVELQVANISGRREARRNFRDQGLALDISPPCEIQARRTFLTTTTSEHNIVIKLFPSQHIYFSFTSSERLNIAIMAEGGIDRKAEERMEFTTSKEVEIGKAELHPRGRGGDI